MKKGEKKPSQTYMFDMSRPEVDNNPLVLKMPPEAQLERTFTMLDAYTKVELTGICTMFTPSDFRKTPAKSWQLRNWPPW